MFFFLNHNGIKKAQRKIMQENNDMIKYVKEIEHKHAEVPKEL